MDRGNLVASLCAFVLLVSPVGGHPRTSPVFPAAPAVRQVASGQTDRPTESAARECEGSGETVWAEGFEGEFLRGMDGELYEPYDASLIRETQETLRNRGLYSCAITGMLDRPTMEAIYAFQEASYGLQLCGVPTPRTRQLLEQGSHTS